MGLPPIAQIRCMLPELWYTLCITKKLSRFGLALSCPSTDLVKLNPQVYSVQQQISIKFRADWSTFGTMAVENDKIHR